MSDEHNTEWKGTGTHSFCPGCGKLTVEVREVLRVKPFGTFSLSGSQLKTTGQWGWEYRCTKCGSTGPCEIRPSSSGSGADET